MAAHPARHAVLLGLVSLQCFLPRDAAQIRWDLQSCGVAVVGGERGCAAPPSLQTCTRPWHGPGPALCSLAVPKPASDGSCLPQPLPSSAQCPPVFGGAGRGAFTPCVPQGAGRAAARHRLRGDPGGLVEC